MDLLLVLLAIPIYIVLLVMYIVISVAYWIVIIVMTIFALTIAASMVLCGVVAASCFIDCLANLLLKAKNRYTRRSSNG